MINSEVIIAFKEYQIAETINIKCGIFASRVLLEIRRRKIAELMKSYTRH